MEVGGNILKDIPNRTNGMRRSKTVTIKLITYIEEVRSVDFIVDIWYRIGNDSIE